MYGAEQENRHIQKSILFVFDCPQTGLYICCDRSHTHLPLRGQGPKGSRNAAAAMYPKELCDSILGNIANMRTTSQDEGRKKLPDKPPHTFAVLAGSDNFFQNMSKYYIDYRNCSQLLQNLASLTFSTRWWALGSSIRRCTGRVSIPTRVVASCMRRRLLGHSPTWYRAMSSQLP